MISHHLASPPNTLISALLPPLVSIAELRISACLGYRPDLGAYFLPNRDPFEKHLSSMHLVGNHPLLQTLLLTL
jgi:hypothetical protein